jgi:hypothetical protein
LKQALLPALLLGAPLAAAQSQPNESETLGHGYHVDYFDHETRVLEGKTLVWTTAELAPKDLGLKDGDFEESGKARPVLPQILSVDGARRKIYFAVSLEDGSNVPLVIYSIGTPASPGGKVEPQLVARDYGSGVGDALLSPDGAYLAYTVGSHAGRCYSTSVGKVIDLAKKREVGMPSPKPEPGQETVRSVASWAWASARRLVIHFDTWDAKKCEKGAKDDGQGRETKTFDVVAAKFL